MPRLSRPGKRSSSGPGLPTNTSKADSVPSMRGTAECGGAAMHGAFAYASSQPCTRYKRAQASIPGIWRTP
eukprot:CAMPEP_0119351454 /NCGR_PEP_ID=MMETSP1334-20130426/726_1 /TAXON_ID=127549 /ORGANISM="Calcidiscus leptoporus, Strain RCC1130" /LENGTH=70 /DNA_ID=CAMNT_0007364251 /DNA_START=297 /DNA_END=509 /DNA_ORIENTATION=-